MISRILHGGMDAVMCAMMNTAQWRLRSHAVTLDRLESYLGECEAHAPLSYYATPDEDPSLRAPDWRRDGNMLSWISPRPCDFVENNTARARLFESGKPSGAPTLILMHALMSASDLGYRRIAARFNGRGWNVLFPHLPYHYSRRPHGYGNGALAVTSDLVRNAETLRQCVTELRQLIGWARRRGSRRVAILATSYGAWTAALALTLEETDFAVLLQPVADVRHATFGSPASRTMAALLKRNGIHPGMIDRHSHLSTPGGLRPLTRPDRILIIGGRHDRLSTPESLASLSAAWGSRYLEVAQGHFGYRAMNLALAETERYL